MTKYYECIDNFGYDDTFTIGELYVLIAKKVTDQLAFIDNNGRRNGFNIQNEKCFKLRLITTKQ